MVCCNTQSSQKAKPCLFFSVVPCLGESEHFTREPGRKGAVCLILKSSSSSSRGCQSPPWLGVPPCSPHGTSDPGLQQELQRRLCFPSLCWAVPCGMGFSSVLFFCVITKSSFVFLFSNSNKKILQYLQDVRNSAWFYGLLQSLGTGQSK